jgi:hypothetical protein
MAGYCVSYYTPYCFNVPTTAVGFCAGSGCGSKRAISLGYKSGRIMNFPGKYNITLGSLAGAAMYDGRSSVIVGQNAGYFSQHYSVSMGAGAHRLACNYCSVALGVLSFCQNGYGAGQGQKFKQTGIGFKAGMNQQGMGTVAIGYVAASNAGGDCLTAIGANTARFGNRTNVTGLGFYSYIYPPPYNNKFQIGRYNTPATSFIRTAWSNVSDSRDKTNIENLPNNLGLNFIRKLRPVTFKFDYRMEYMYKCGFEFGVKDGTLKKTETNYGFLAQQIEETAKELNVKFDGITYNSHSDIYRIKNLELLSPIVKAIQELNNELDIIEQQIG